MSGAFTLPDPGLKLILIQFYKSILEIHEKGQLPLPPDYVDEFCEIFVRELKEMLVDNLNE